MPARSRSLDYIQPRSGKYDSQESIRIPVLIHEQTNHTFSYPHRFLATYVMAPTAHVLVYYMQDDGEIIADALDVHLEGTLQNSVHKNLNIPLIV